MNRLIPIVFLAAASVLARARGGDIWRTRPAGLVAGFDCSGHRTTSPTGHSGTLAGNAVIANGTRYIAVDGSGDYMSVADAPEFSFVSGTQDQPFSVMAWVYLSSSPGGNVTVIAKSSSSTTYEWALRISSGAGAYPQFVCLNTNATAYRGRVYTTAVSTGQWVHLAGVYDGSEATTGFKLFLNGSRVDNSNVTAGSYTGMTDTASPVTFGSAVSGEYLNGRIADSRIYRRAVADEEVAQVANTGAARIAQGGTP